MLWLLSLTRSREMEKSKTLFLAVVYHMHKELQRENGCSVQDSWNLHKSRRAATDFGKREEIPTKAPIYNCAPAYYHKDRKLSNIPPAWAALLTGRLFFIFLPI